MEAVTLARKKKKSTQQPLYETVAITTNKIQYVYGFLRLKKKQIVVSLWSNIYFFSMNTKQ